MDCRKPLLVAIALLTASTGCTTPTRVVRPVAQQACVAPMTATAEPKLLPAIRDAEDVKRQPKASTSVAWAVYREREAAASSDTSIKPRLLEEARVAYQQALKTDPEYLPAYSGLARVYEQLGTVDRSLETYQQALKKFPNEPALWFELGMVHARRKNWNQAVANLQKAHELDPESRHFGQTLGLCLARAGRIDESLACLTRAIGPAQAHYNLGRMLVHLKREDEARQHLRQALQRDPNLRPAQDLLARLEVSRLPEVPRATLDIQFEAR